MDIEILSTLRAHFKGNLQVTGGFPHRGPVTQAGY